MRGGLNIVPNILKKHHTVSTNNNRSLNCTFSPKSNTSQARNRMNITAKNKYNAEIMDLKMMPPKDGDKQTRVFVPKDHAVFMKDKTYHWCPHHILGHIHTAANYNKGKGWNVNQKAAKKKR